MKKRLCALLLAISLLPLGGCWDHMEISKALIVAGLGLDVGPDGSGYHATVEIISVEAGRGENITASVVEGTGPTIQSALQDAVKTTGGTLYGNHCKVVVVGETLARRGVHPVLEFILRSPSFRKTVNLLMARGETARAILTHHTVNNDIRAYELSKIAISNARSYQNTVTAGVYELHELLLSDTPFAAAPAVYTRTNLDDAVLQVDGCALFAGDKLVSFAEGDRMPLFHLLTGRAQNVSIRLELPDAPDGALDGQVLRSQLVLTPDASAAVPALQIDLRVELSLRDAVQGGLDLSDRATAEAIQTALGDRLAVQLHGLIAEVQQTGTDVFGFYRPFEEHCRRQWRDLKDDWAALFRNLRVNVRAEVIVKTDGLIGGYYPGKDGDGGNALP